MRIIGDPDNQLPDKWNYKLIRLLLTFWRRNYFFLNFSTHYI